MVKMGQLEAIRLIRSLTTEKDLILGNMSYNTFCMQTVVRSEGRSSPPKNLLFGVDMGFCTAMATGLALALPHRKVISVDGDGGILMNLAVLADAAEANPSNLIIVIMDNESYMAGKLEWTVTRTVADLAAIAKGAGIKNVATVWTTDELKKEFKKAMARNKLSLIVVKCEIKPEERDQLFDQRWWVDVEWDSGFIRNIEETEGIKLITEWRMKGSQA